MGKENKEARRKALLVLTVITSFIYIFWRIFFTVPTDAGVVSLIAGIALVVAETIGVLESFQHYRNMSSAKNPDKPEIPMEWYPDVDVFVATHNESVELLYKTVNGCMHMDYPDKEKVHIYICDDNDRPEMKKLAEEMGVGYFGLANNKHAKAGNLNNALSKSHSPLVATFDADMIPRNQFLMETVPYFFLPKMEKDKDGLWKIREEEDKKLKIGFIQTPQSFYNPDLFQYNLYSENRIPNEQDYFFREVNVGRNRTSSPIYAGSNTLLSREALEEVGGIVIGTITEDFATGIEIQKKGYTCYAIDKALAHGLSPTDVKSLIKQRERWGRGCVQTLRNIKFFFSRELKFGAKASYLSCLMYWWTFLRRFIYILSPILFAVFHVKVVDCSLIELLLIWLPSYVLYNYTLRVVSGNIRNQRWSNVVDTIIFPYLIIPILIESIGLKLKKFAVTGKDGIDSSSTIKYAIPHILLMFASLFGVIICIRDSVRYETIGNIVVIYWLIVNVYNLVMAIFFMLGRKNYRRGERFLTKEKAVVSFDDNAIRGETVDVSEQGMGLMLEFPYYIPYQKNVKMKITTLWYQSEMEVSLVHVVQKGKLWKYSFQIAEITEEDKRKYFQIVYDRDHTLSHYMSRSSSILDDLAININKRVSHVDMSNRKLPRINMNQEIIVKEGEMATIRNFNYEYILLKTEMKDKELTLDLGEGLEMKCEIDERISQNKDASEKVYSVMNIEEILSNPKFKSILSTWIIGYETQLGQEEKKESLEAQNEFDEMKML